MKGRIFFLCVLIFLTSAAVLHAQSVEFIRVLHFGDLGEDVLLLQQILNSDPATLVASSGDGSPGAETTYFGNRTRLAVIRFQMKYALEILTPAGLSSPTGIMGNYTRVKLNTLRAQIMSEQLTPSPTPPGINPSPSSNPPVSPTPITPTPSPSNPSGVSYSVNVYRAGAGDVIAPNISCGSDCFEEYGAGTTVSLQPVARAGYVFSFWSGDCSGAGTCVLLMDRSHVVAATFRDSTSAPTPPPILPPPILTPPIVPPVVPPPIFPPPVVPPVFTPTPPPVVPPVVPPPVTPPPILPPPIVPPPVTPPIVPPPPPPAPTVTLAAVPISVTSGTASTLSWSSSNATSCSASGGWTGAKVVSGSQTTGALSVTTTFTLSCSGAGGSLTKSVTVSVTAPPTPPTPAGYTAAQVALHSVKTDCWYYILGKVYNITPFFGNHKGGDSKLLAYCGKDAYKGFYQDHSHGSSAKTLLNSFEIGPLIAMTPSNSLIATVAEALKAPIDLSAVVASAYHVNLLWSPDPMAADYVIYRNGVELGIVNGLAFTDSALFPNTRYVYTVGSRNSSHMLRGMSLSAPVVTLPQFPCAPSTLGVIPCGVLKIYPEARLWSQNIDTKGASSLRIFSKTGQCRKVETNGQGAVVSDNVCSNG